MSDSGEETRQGRRAEKLRKKRYRMKMHGKSLGKIYLDAVRKRAEKER